jgi:hypothetical protein
VGTAFAGDTATLNDWLARLAAYAGADGEQHSDRWPRSV